MAASKSSRMGTPSQHTFDVGNCLFTIDTRYSYNRVIGRGAYGTVISCRDIVTGKDVAIKKITRAFEDATDAKRLLRELMLLRHLKHENTIGLLDIIQPSTGVNAFDDIYMVLELMETDLHRIIHSKQDLTDDHVQFFISQVLKALKYMHSAGVLHRDLKPSNLLVNASCDLKVCDFGLARGVNEDDLVLTEYVVTRWYRAPEVMLSSKSYTYGVDVWSTGCILAELLMRKPLFQGEDYINQLHLINDVLGSPPDEDLEFVTSERARRFMKSLSKTPGIPLNRLIPNANPLALDLLKKMLAFNPAKRISVEEALNHPYLEEFAHDETMTKCQATFDFRYEQESLDAMRLRELVWKEICHFRPEAQVALDEFRAHQNNSHDDEPSVPSGSSDAGSVRQIDASDDSLKRRRLEDTITPMKSSKHDPSLFSPLPLDQKSNETE